MEVVVSAEDNAEVRRVSLTNYSNRTREIELTSYAKLCSRRRPDDVAHPAFSNLFIETEFSRPRTRSLRTGASARRKTSRFGAFTCWRRRRNVGGIQYETDRGRFLGRGHTYGRSDRGDGGSAVSNTVGAVLDPVFSLRRRVRLQPNETRPGCFHHRRRANRANRRWRSRQVSRSEYLRTRVAAGLDQGAGRDESPEDRCGRGAPVSATGGRILYSILLCVRGRTCWR